MRKILKSSVFKDFAIIFIVLGLITLLFNVTRLDISLQSYFYSPEKGWFLKFKPFWDYFYRFGIFPGYLFGLGGLIMISLSYWLPRYVKYRRAALMLVYTLIVGPGLIINLGLKDHFGRPRPFEVKEFGGKQQFLSVCIPGGSNGGKSFPCGHCSMGFFVAVPYLLFRNKNRKSAYAFLAAGMIYGLLIGISRMIAGGHFASDVLWSGGLVWLIALTGVSIFKVDKTVELNAISVSGNKKKARLVTLLVSLILLVITLALALATPYISEKSVLISEPNLLTNKTTTLLADLKDATVDIVQDTCVSIEYKVNAFGFPNSKIRGRLTYGDTTRFHVQWMGWFTEVSNNFKIGIPAGIKRDYIVKVNKGNIFCTVPDNAEAGFFININKGNLYLKLNSNEYFVAGVSSIAVNESGKAIHWIEPASDQKIQKVVRYSVLKGKVYFQ
jgi:lipid A 4'-phosphatase